MWDLIVWSDNTVDFVPSEWANEDCTKYKYPQGLTETKVRQYIYDCKDLQSKFTWCSARLKKRSIKDLKKARELCQQAEETSNLDTEDSESQTEKDSGGLNKTRSRKRPVRFIEEDSAECEIRFAKRGKTDEESSDDETDIEERRTFKVPAPLPFLYDMAKQPAPLRTTSRPTNIIGKNLLRPLVDREHSAEEKQLSEDEDATIDDSSHVHMSTPRSTRKSPAAESSLENSNTTFGSASTLTLIDPSETGSGRSSETNILCTTHEFNSLKFELKEIIRRLDRLESHLLLTTSLAGATSSGASNSDKFITTLIKTLPVTTNEGLQNLNQELTNDAKKVAVIKMLALLGGDTVRKTVFLIMDKLMDKKLCLEYSGQGKKKKKALKQLTDLYNVVIESTRKRHTEATEEQIKKNISLFLASAKQRLPKRHDV